MRNNAWIALAIVGIIMAFALNSDGGSGGPIDVQEDGSPVVNNTFVLDFQTPLTATDDGGDADIGLAVNDCDAADNALTFSVGPNTFGCNTIISSAALNVELNGTVTVTGADVIDFLSPFNVTDDAGDAQIDLPLANDNVFVGNASGVPSATAINDCDALDNALTYDTTGNAFGCNTIITAVDVEENGGVVVTGTNTLNFLDPFDVTDVAGNADIFWDAAEINDTTFGNNTAGIIDWGFNPSGATNPVMRISNGQFAFDTITTFTIDGTLNADLPDDNTWIGSAAGKSVATAWPDCDLNFQATTYSTGSNAIGCQFIPTSWQLVDPPGTSPWTLPGYTCNSGSTSFASQQNDITYGLIVPPQTLAYTAIGINVTSAGAGGTVARLGIYEADQTSTGLTPGALVVDAGTVSIASTGVKSIAITETLNGGQPYFLALAHDAAAVSLTTCDVLQRAGLPLTSKAVTPATSLNAGALEDGGAGIGAFADPAPAPDAMTSDIISTSVRLME